MQRLIEAI